MAEPNSDQNALSELYRKMWRCMVEKDIAGLASVCADDFTLHHMTGMEQRKPEFLQAVADGMLTYYEATHDSVEARVSSDGCAAQLTGRTRVVAAVFGGGRHRWRLECRLAARKEGGSWRFSDEFVSPY